MTETAAATSVRPPIDYPVLPLDEILRDASKQWPTRTAISSRSGTVTFEELNAAADRYGAALHALVGGPGQRIAVATELSPAFAAAFYGIVRSGGVAVTLNPIHRPEAVARTIAASGAVLAIVTPTMYQQLAALSVPLPRLLPLTGDADPDLGSLQRLADATLPVPLPVSRPDAIACVHFTSGTTGEPKAVQLTHRNLIANAAQTAQAHSLGTASVSFNCLPAYHLMHLNAAVYAGATQVLYGAPALAGRGVVADSVAEANRVGATHYYTLPLLLARLAREPELASCRPGALSGMFCGGSALAAPVAQALSAHFGIPVLQGFGLAEASSMSHLDRPDRPRPGSCGVPAADTECRIVDVDTRAPLPVGQAGEIEVRGPQIMAGYADGSPGVNADGWLPTGDVGRVDTDGYLYLVDRLKDVFKCDNELVSPSELESVVSGHPAVRDCAVVDRQDALRGAVPVALLVLGESGATPSDVVEYANERLAGFQQIVAATVVAEIPRTPIGKIARRDLRTRVSASL
jgi:long-chain acyl-CoA synthetase